MFVKKLVEKASKHIGGGGGGSISGLRAEDVSPRLSFHYGVPAGSSVLAYDPFLHILAVATIDGRIKLFGRDNSQALLQSEEAAPTKFLQFFENEGILVKVTAQDHIEVWDVEKKELCCLHIFGQKITSLAILQQSLFMYVGDSLGNISMLKLESELHQIIHMDYRIPFAESYGKTAEVASNVAVVHILPQPTAESKRVLIIFEDGLLSLWGISESKVLVTGGISQQSSHHESKIVVSACWACPVGSKVVVGYSSGDIFIWAIQAIPGQKNVPLTNKKESYAAPNIPILKLNLGYKMDKVPIVSLHWVIGDGKASRLYVNGFCKLGSHNSFQIILLNENTESRMIKLVLPLTEACIAMKIISCLADRSKQNKNALVLLSKSGHLCLYDDSEIERYLLQCQSRTIPTLPNQLVVKVPYGDSTITVGKLYAGNYSISSPFDEDKAFLANGYYNLLSADLKERDGGCISSRVGGFTKTRSLYITGHNDGSINFWDASCPLLVHIFSFKQQGEDSSSLSVIPVTALHFDICSQVLVGGYRNGLVRIITFRKEQSASENIFSFIHAKQGINHTVQCVKLDGAILSININFVSKHLAAGTDEGHVSVIHMEEASILYQKQLSCELYAGIISLQFEKYIENGFEKNILLVGTENSSVFVLEEDTGNALSTNIVHTKKPTRGLLMQILDDPNGPIKGASRSEYLVSSNECAVKDNVSKQSLILFCSEKAVRLYFLGHAIQGIKKLYTKKKLNGTCRFASVIFSQSSNVGLLLLFACGKMEIRVRSKVLEMFNLLTYNDIGAEAFDFIEEKEYFLELRLAILDPRVPYVCFLTSTEQISLPDLALLKEASLRGLTFSNVKSHTNIGHTVCASSAGELMLIFGDQEIFFFSVLFQKDEYRHLEYISQVCRKDVGTFQERPLVTTTCKDKKKNIFSLVIQDLKGNKTRLSQEVEAITSGSSIAEEVSSTFSTANFPLDDESKLNSIKPEDGDIDIDDIDLEEATEKPKGRTFPGLNKQKLGKKFQAITGKMKVKKDEKLKLGDDNHEDEKAGSVDQIKKKYGYTTNNDASIPRMVQNKLSENVRKLQGIGERTGEMESTAHSFSSMARDLLRTVQDRNGS